MLFFVVSDCDTTDEEYEQNSELAAAESDVCSVLDEDEQVNEAPCHDNGPGLSNRNTDKEGDSNSDDDVIVPTLVKKKSTANRILDSDDEDEIENPGTDTAITLTQPVSCTDHTIDTRSVIGSNSTIPKPESYRSFPSSEYSMSLFDSATTSTSDPAHNEASKKDSVVRRTSFLMNQEASMPPLMLNVSEESEDSDNERGSPIQNHVSGRFAGSGSTFGLPKDSGVGTMTRVVEDEDSQLTVDTACK